MRNIKNPAPKCSHKDLEAPSNVLVSKFTNKENTRNYEKWSCSVCKKSFIV